MDSKIIKNSHKQELKALAMLVGVTFLCVGLPAYMYLIGKGHMTSAIGPVIAWGWIYWFYGTHLLVSGIFSMIYSDKITISEEKELQSLIKTILYSKGIKSEGDSSESVMIRFEYNFRPVPILYYQWKEIELDNQGVKDEILRLILKDEGVWKLTTIQTFYIQISNLLPKTNHERFQYQFLLNKYRSNTIEWKDTWVSKLLKKSAARSKFKRLEKYHGH